MRFPLNKRLLKLEDILNRSKEIPFYNWIESYYYFINPSKLLKKYYFRHFPVFMPYVGLMGRLYIGISVQLSKRLKEEGLE